MPRHRPFDAAAPARSRQSRKSARSRRTRWDSIWPSLSEENQDVIQIESDPGRADLASQQPDVLTRVGKGASLPVLEQAGVGDVGMPRSVTS